MAAIGMAVNSGARLWGPYRALYDVVDAAIFKHQPGSVHDLEMSLRKHKPDFISLLKTQAKNAVHREAVKKSSTEGIPLRGEQRSQTFSQQFIAEALILSDLFNMDELASVELLMAGEQQLPNYPGLTRGLVAVLLFYDGRRSIVNALRALIQAREGRTWTVGVTTDVSALVNSFTNQLVEEGLVNNILDLIKSMDLVQEIDKLQKQRALGPPKHKKQVTDLFQEIKLSLAECVFCLACQQPLSKTDTMRLVAHLREDNSLEANSTLDPVVLSLLMALLYCFDVSILDHEDAESTIEKLPVISDSSYVAEVHRVLMSDQRWVIPGIKCAAQFAWGIMLRQLSQYPLASGINEFCEDDEGLLDIAIDGNVFAFLKDAIVSRTDFHQEEFYTKRIHGLITDFIYYMPLKVKELRNRGDEIARIVIAHQAEGLEIPPHRRDLENIFQLISDLYSKDPLSLELSLEYWCPPETSGLHESMYTYRPPPRQVALYKFVRLAGDLLPPPLYVPYINMITGLARSPQAAQHCFSLLKMNGVNSGGSAGSVSWDHIFASLNKYFATLRLETASAMETSHMYRAPPTKGIKVPEQDAIAAVLQLTKCVAEQNENCRWALYENQQWGVIGMIFGLVSCNIPTTLKADLFQTLSALSKTPSIAAYIWQTLEATQILSTSPNPDQKGGIQIELDEIESRNEEYPMTRAFLELIDRLTDIPIPAGLGAGFRVPGFDPYLHFIIESVFLKFSSRAYRNAQEKWQVAGLCLSILCKLLREHEMSEEDFREQLVEVQGGGVVASSKPPGHTLMLNMLKDTGLLKMILHLLDDTVKQFEQYSSVVGKQWLDKASEFCLKMLECTLEKEEQFERMIRDSGTGVMVTSMDRLLLSINPHSKKADHLVNIAKFIVFNNFLPQHALSAVNILYCVCQSTPVQSELVGLFTADETISSSLLQGFVECLENDEPELRNEEKEQKTDLGDDVSTSQVHNLARQHIIQLMLHAMNQPAPNLAHWMLGFEVRKPVHKTNLQDPGILGSPRTCLHSILTLLDNGIGTRRGPLCLTETPKLAELSYHLVYVLAANKDTSSPFLRYIRTTHDFLFKQLHHLPFRSQEAGCSLSNQQAWLLKTIAIELRITALNRQRSHTQRLLKLLLSDTDEEQTAVLQPVGAEESDSTVWDRETSIFQSGTPAHSQQMSAARQMRRKLLCLLDSIGFEELYPQPLQLKVFDTKMIEQVITSCERRTHENVIYWDVRQLRRILINELNKQQGTMMAGQRPMIMEEIQAILSTVVARNGFRESLFTKRQTFESWRQVTEVLLTACPEDLLSGETRQTVIFELLQDLLVKVSDEDTLPELTAPVAGVILTLMGNLRQCFLTDPLPRAGTEISSYVPLLDQSTPVVGADRTGSRTLFATSLQTVLKGLLDYILRSGGRAQRSRANLYGALLYYLQIAQKPSNLTPKKSDELSVDKVLGENDTEYEQLSKENLATIHSYGDRFMEIVCRDACDGHDIGRMLALSLLDMVISIDYYQQWMTFLSAKGYLQHLVDSLVHDDPHLQKILEPNPAQLKTLYIYQSKMSLLTQIGETAEGAHLLLRCSIMQKLASCGFFELRPETESQAGEEPQGLMDDEFIPSPLTRYRILLFSALKLCLAVLTSHGIENKDVAAQVMLFLMSHGEIFNAILHSRKPSMNLATLRELALTTAVIARASFHNELGCEYLDSDTAMVEFQGERARIQRQMLSLLTQYSFSDKFSKQLLKLDVRLASHDVKAQIGLAYQQIASNIVTFCRSLLTESGPCSQYSRILFGPCLEEGNVKDLQSSEELQYSNFGANQSPNLGIVVYQLKQCCTRFLSVYDSHRQHSQKLASIYELSTEDLKELSGLGSTEKMSSQQRQELARKRLQTIVSYKAKELQHYAYIIENCLFIVWRHLEYYLVHCIAVDQQPLGYQTHIRRQQNPIRKLQEITGMHSPIPSEQEMIRPQFQELSRGITRDEMELLKQTAPSIISESLFKKIQDINQCYSKNRSHYSFTEAVVRRIKRLLRLHTGS